MAENGRNDKKMSGLSAEQYSVMINSGARYAALNGGADLPFAMDYTFSQMGELRQDPVIDLTLNAAKIYESLVAQYESELAKWESSDKDKRGKKPERPEALAAAENDYAKLQQSAIYRNDAYEQNLVKLTAGQVADVFGGMPEYTPSNVRNYFSANSGTLIGKAKGDLATIVSGLEGVHINGRVKMGIEAIRFRDVMQSIDGKIEERKKKEARKKSE